MKTKSTAVRYDSDGVEKSLTFKDYFTDGFGTLALNTMSGVMSLIIYFYTDKLMLSVGFVSVMLTIPRVLDAITDVIMGDIIDRHKFKNGRYRPWMLWCAVPLGISMVLTFMMPVNMPMAVTGIYIVLGSLLVQGIFGTAIYVAYYALLGARTRSNEERGKLNLARSVFGLVAALLGSILYIPLANALGGDRRAYIIISVVYAVIITLSVLITYWGSRELEEEVTEEKEEKENLFQCLLLLFKNPYWVRLAIVAFAVQLVTSLHTAGGAYYAKYIFGDDNITSIVGLSTMAAMVIGLILIGLLRGKVSGTNFMRAGFAVGIVGLVLRSIFPTNLAIYIVGSLFAGLTAVTTWAYMIMFVNNCAEYNELHFGKPMRAISNSSSSFAQKLSSSLGTILAGAIMAAAGYSAALPAQPEQVSTALIIINSALPAALYVVCLVAFGKFDLEKKYSEIVRELNKKKAAQE